MFSIIICNDYAKTQKDATKNVQHIEKKSTPISIQQLSQLTQKYNIHINFYISLKRLKTVVKKENKNTIGTNSRNIVNGQCCRGNDFVKKRTPKLLDMSTISPILVYYSNFEQTEQPSSGNTRSSPQW